MLKKILSALGGLVAAAVSFLLVGLLLVVILFGTGIPTARPQKESVEVAVGERFRMYMTNRISTALEGVIDIEKVYWLSDSDLVAPKPREENFGTSKDAASLQWLLDDAQKLLEGQDTVFSTETPLAPDSEVTYYLDETIFTVTWKQVFDDSMYTISEVKIAHPSQFRRFLAGGTYGSGIQLLTTQMADSVNAVVASSGDFYAHRRYGVIVYDGVVQRSDPKWVDTCFIDDKGDLLFSYRGQLQTMEEAEKFVEENNIRFSIAFGPVLIDNGQPVTTREYIVGEINEEYARSALCQMGPLHYLLVVCARQGNFNDNATLKTFQKVVSTFGPEKAYTLDGGQTAVIAMRGKPINRVMFDAQREISDILYFATAVPSHEE